jgi:hypothetical protein
MGRPKLYDIDPNRLLAAIVAQYRGRLATIAAERATQQAAADARGHDWPQHDLAARELDRRRDEITSNGLVYNLPLWLGHDPTASERIIAQRAIRLLESQGLLTILGAHARWVKPTPAGLAATEAAHA